MNIGIIGFGYWGQIFYSKIVAIPYFQVLTICDRNPKNLSILTKQSITKTTNPTEVLLDSKVELVLIMTQVASHFELIKRALEKGKNVLVTKPFVLRTSEATSLIQLANTMGCKLFLDHTYLFSAPWIAIQKQLRQIEPLLVYDSIRTQFGKFQMGSNVLWELLYHDLYIISSIPVGATPISISALGGAHRSVGTLDVASIKIKYASGLDAFFHVSMVSAQKQRKITMTSKSNIIEWDDLKQTQRVLTYRATQTKCPESGRSLDKLEEPIELLLNENDAIQSELEHCYECLRRSCKPKNNVLDSLRVTRLLELVEESIANNGKELYYDEADLG
ncbi:MAG: Gfo/Idh/MocA family oxidoreductase [Bdellovibrionia bacterium]